MFTNQILIYSFNVRMAAAQDVKVAGTELRGVVVL